LSTLETFGLEDLASAAAKAVRAMRSISSVV